jgi:hypothetical protein
MHDILALRRCGVSDTRTNGASLMVPLEMKRLNFRSAFDFADLEADHRAEERTQAWHTPSALLALRCRGLSEIGTAGAFSHGDFIEEVIDLRPTFAFQ